MSDQHGAGDTHMFTEAFWDERYSASERIWSGRPNPRLVEQASDLEPGTALDVGCGEGADVVWLAARGWQVTGVDVSGVALDRAAAHAEQAGVAERTTWARADLLAGDPLPTGLDLVSVQFLHVPPPDLARVMGTIADAVRPGGTLLVVGHHPDDAATGLRNARLSHLLYPPEHVVAVLDPGGWQVLVAAAPTREVIDADGQPVVVTDTVVRAVRTASG